MLCNRHDFNVTICIVESNVIKVTRLPHFTTLSGLRFFPKIIKEEMLFSSEQFHKSSSAWQRMSCCYAACDRNYRNRLLSITIHNMGPSWSVLCLREGRRLKSIGSFARQWRPLHMRGATDADAIGCDSSASPALDISQPRLTNNLLFTTFTLDPRFRCFRNHRAETIHFTNSLWAFIVYY